MHFLWGGVKPTCDKVQVATLFSLPSKNLAPPWISPAQPQLCFPVAGLSPSPPDDGPLRPTGPPSPGTSAPPQSSTPHSTVGSGSVEPPPPSLQSQEASKGHPRFGRLPSRKKFVLVQGGVCTVRQAAVDWGVSGLAPAQLWGGCRRLPTPSIPSSYHTFLFHSFHHLPCNLCPLPYFFHKVFPIFPPTSCNFLKCWLPYLFSIIGPSPLPGHWTIPHFPFPNISNNLTIAIAIVVLVPFSSIRLPPYDSGIPMIPCMKSSEYPLKHATPHNNPGIP